MTRFGRLLLIGAVPAALTAQGVPPSPPPPAPLVSAPFPPFQEATLPNGIRLVLVESHEQPVLSITLALPAGTSYEIVGKTGLADMVAGLITKGAGSRSGNQVAEAIEGVGGSLSAGAGADFLSIQADGLSANAPLFFELLADAVIRPTFSPDELELLRRQQLTGLQAEQAEPENIAERTFAKELYGDHPYGRRATPESVRGITRKDVLAFHQARCRPEAALLVLAGDLTLADATRLATAAFRDWKGRPATGVVPKAPPIRSRTEIVLVNRPGSVQSNILVGNTIFVSADTNYFAAQIANRVLGGGADSRLFLILREQRGWTYGAYSTLNRYKGPGSFEAGAEVRTEVTDSALRELLAQLRRIGTEPIPAAELEAAKSAMVGSFPLSVQTANQIASEVARVRLLGLATDYLKTYRTRLAAETAARVQTVARSIIRPQASLIVIVGDGARILAKLKPIAPVRIITPDGRPLTEAELTARPRPLDLNLSQLVPYQDTLVAIASGKPLGIQVATFSRRGDELVYREETTIGTAVNQMVEVTMSPTGEMRKVSLSGTIRGQENKLELTYAPGRVQGFATVASPQGPRTVTIDTAVVQEVLDENAIQGLLPAIRWEPKATWKLPVFSGSQNRVRLLNLSVTGTEKVALPHGLADTYRAELSGDDQMVTFFITTAVPHRLVKVVVGNSGLQFVSSR